jgi:hypothetical protein
MSDERPRAQFNIGSQQGNISNVAGDMIVHGGQRYVAVPADAIREELAKFRQILSTVPLNPESQRTTEVLLVQATQELDQPQPDAQRVAGPIERLTRVLKDAGALASAGAALIDPLQANFGGDLPRSDD